MDVDTIVSDNTLTAETLTPEQKTFLTTNQDQLTDYELVRFGLKTEEKPPVKKEEEDDNKKKDDDDDKGGDGEMDPEDKKKIGGLVKKEMAPIIKQQQELQRTTTINAFIQANPDYAKYQKSIMSKMDAVPGLSVADAAAIVSSRDMQIIGARKEREAQKKVLETRGTGSSSRTFTPTGKDWGTAPKSDYEAQKARVLGRQGA